MTVAVEPDPPGEGPPRALARLSESRMLQSARALRARIDVALAE